MHYPKKKEHLRRPGVMILPSWRQYMRNWDIIHSICVICYRLTMEVNSSRKELSSWVLLLPIGAGRPCLLIWIRMELWICLLRQAFIADLMILITANSFQENRSVIN